MNPYLRIFSIKFSILGHSVQGILVHYLTLEDEDLKETMDEYAGWFDTQIANITQTVAEAVKNGPT
jgi:hypothetical protein